MIFLNFLIFASSATVLCAQKLTEAWSPNAENSTCRETDISERDVYFHIFKDYSNLTRPVLDFRDTVIVNISVRFEKIVDVVSWMPNFESAEKATELY